MKKIMIELFLTETEWEELQRRATVSYPSMKNEFELVGESISYDEAIENEIRYIVSKSLET